MPEWRLTKLREQFAVTWDEPEGRRRYSLGTADKAEAIRLAPGVYATKTRPKGRTVADLWACYVIDKDGRAVLATMAHTWKALAPRFAGKDGDRITVQDCRAHTEARRKAGIQDGTIHTELGHLRTVLKWGEKNGLISRASHIERPPKAEPRDRHLTHDEYHAILDAAVMPHLKLAIRLMRGTGARIGAVLELTWDRVDLDRRTINLRNPFDRTRRKGRATVSIGQKLVEALREARQVAMTPNVIEWAGRPVASIKTGLKAAAERAHVKDVSPHVFRHSAAVWLAEAGHPMEEISQFLGHADVKITTKVYARFSPTHLRALADTLDT